MNLLSSTCAPDSWQLMVKPGEQRQFEYWSSDWKYRWTLDKTLKLSSCRICFLGCSGVVKKALSLDKSEKKGEMTSWVCLQNYDIVNPIHRIVAERKTRGLVLPPYSNSPRPLVTMMTEGTTQTWWPWGTVAPSQVGPAGLKFLDKTTTSRYDRQCLWRGNFHDQRWCHWPVISFITHKPQDTGWFMLVPTP